MNEFSTLFGLTGNDTVDKLKVTDITVSTNNNSIEIEFATELSSRTEELVKSQIKKRLGNVRIGIGVDGRYEHGADNVMVYYMPKTSEAAGGPKVIGKAQAEDVLIGRPIRNQPIVSIDSINEGSGLVTISGRIFDSDEREKPRKNPARKCIW